MKTMNNVVVNVDINVDIFEESDKVYYASVLQAWMC